MNQFLMVVCIVVLIGLFMLWPAKRNNKLCAPFWGFNFAHRGLHNKSKTIPENSLPAFRAAVSDGYGMELDVQLSKDGQVVVFHDDDLERVCGAQGRVDSYTFEELRKMRLVGTEEKIPLFTEVLDAVAGQTPMVVELKMGPRNKELCEKTYALLKSYEGDYCVESFDPRIVRWFKKNARQVVRGQLAASPKTLGNGILGVLVGSLLCNFLGRPHFISYHKAGGPFTVPIVQSGAMRVVWTVEDTDDYEKLQEENDAVIFEHYTPEPRYKMPPEAAPKKGRPI